MKIHILSTSDIHGWIMPDDFTGNKDASFGLARVKTLIDDFKKTHPEDTVFVVDNGDFIQGSPLTNFIAQSHREYSGIFEKLSSDIGFDVRTIGNHEFNYGVDYLVLATENNNNIVSANVFKNDKSLFKRAYKIFEVNNIKIGFLGLTTEFVSTWEREEHIPNMEFKNPVEVAKKIIPEMKKAGAEIIVVLYHSGFEADLKTGVLTERMTGENRGYQLLQEVSDIDALISGHQHRIIATEVKTPFGNVPTTQPGQKGEYVGHIELNFENNKIKSSKAELLETKKFKPSETIIQDIQEIQTQTDEYLDTVIGELDGDYLYDDYFQARLKSHPVIDLMNQVMGKAVDAEISANSIFNNSVPGFKKEITRRDIAINYLYPNTSVAENLTGQDILDALEQSAHFFEVEDGKIVENPLFTKPKLQYYNYDIFTGIDYVIDASKPHNHKLVEASFKGEEIDPKKIYRVALSNFRANGTGGYKMFSMNKAVFENTLDMAEILEEYITKNSPLSLKTPHNLKVINGEEF